MAERPESDPENGPESRPELDDGAADARSLGAWRAWLARLDADGDAVLAASLIYRSLSPVDRDAWLSALELDADSVAVPRLALYAPLLAVEEDAERTARIGRALESTLPPPAASPAPTRALSYVEESGAVACALLTPVYLDFVGLVLCRHRPDRGIELVRIEGPIHAERAVSRASELLGCPLAPALLEDVVESMAHAVVADRRGGRPACEPLRRLAHLFDPVRPRPPGEEIHAA